MVLEAGRRMAPGPDQAIGWVIAFACFFINVIMAGLARTAGVLYVALIELYGISRESATTPFSIRVCMRNMSGPLIGILGQKYGIRGITTLGGLVAALGSILCYFAPNILWITIYWGCIHGIGFGLSTVLHMVVVSQYFDKYKASALGLGYSGDCFGTFVFPVIMESLLNTYDLKGTFLILGGIVLNVVPMALLLKKPPWLENKRIKNLQKKNTNIPEVPDLISKNSDSKGTGLQGIRNEAFQGSDIDLNRLQIFQNCQNDTVSVRSDDPPEYQEGMLNTTRFSRTSIPIDSSPASGSHRISRKSSDISDIIRESTERHDSLPPLPEKEILPPGNLSCMNVSKCTESQNNGFDLEEKPDGNKVQHSSCVKRRASSIGQMAQDLVHKMRSASFASQVAQDGYITSIQQDQTTEEETTIKSYDHVEKLAMNDDPFNLNGNKFTAIKEQELILSANGIKELNIVKQTTKTLPNKEEKPQSMIMTFVRTNTKPIFILISLSMAVYAFLFVGVLTIIIDYAVDNGVSQDEGKYLIIAFSVTDLIGRLSFGQIIDRKLMKMKNYSGVTMLLMGILVASIPLNRSFKFMVVCMSLYGLIQGGTAIMFPILISYYMERNEESVAMGCVNFYGGLLMLPLAPMIGYFRDNTGSYDWVFHILGLMTAMVGIAWQLEPLIIKYQNKRSRLNYVVVTKM